MSSSTTMMSSSAGGGSMQIPTMMVGGGAGGTQTTEVTTDQKNLKAKDGKILDMQQSANKQTSNKEMIIPIQIQGQPSSIQQKPARTPKPRMLPFEFPSLPSMSMSMDPFDMGMPSASDMMAKMQLDMQKQMGSMMEGMSMQMGSTQMGSSQMGSMQMGSSQMGSMGSMTMGSMGEMAQMEKKGEATPQKSQPKVCQSEEQSVPESVEEVQNQDIFVPLRHVGKVQKEALSEATAMAKMRDGVFELVVNIQGFEPEEVQIFSIGQTVTVKAKATTHEGLVANTFEQNFNLPDDVDTDKLTSGMSKDGILMIRVPRRASVHTIIPIKKEVQMEVVKNALNMNETSVEQLHAELEEANIVPLSVEKPEDA